MESLSNACYYTCVISTFCSFAILDTVGMANPTTSWLLTDNGRSLEDLICVTSVFVAVGGYLVWKCTGLWSGALVCMCECDSIC